MTQGIAQKVAALNLIAAVDRRWGIGRQGQLLFHIREDMKRFRALTIGHIIIYGRKTLETFPGSKILADRENIILTRQADFKAGGAVIVHSVEELMAILGQRPGKMAFVIGGTSVYQQLLPFCQSAYVTKVEAVVAADSFLPNLDQLPGWHLIEQENLIRTSAGIIGYEQPAALDFRFCLYRQDKGGQVG
jgi:dihydrofolate reductase